MRSVFKNFRSLSYQGKVLDEGLRLVDKEVVKLKGRLDAMKATDTPWLRLKALKVRLVGGGD